MEATEQDQQGTPTGYIGQIDAPGVRLAGAWIIGIAGVACAFLLFPIGLIPFAFCLWIAIPMAKQLVCSNCGNQISNKQVKICPCCQTTF